MSEKKRKRESREDGAPRKRVEVHAPSAIVKVKFVDDEDGIGPILASTAGCLPPKHVIFQPYKKRLEKGSNYEYLLHSSAHPALDYIAYQERSGSANSTLKHYIGVFDQATSHLTVAEVPRLVLRSRLRPTQKELDEEEQQNNSRQAIKDARQALGMEFGTKKAKKALHDLTENAINPQKNRADTEASTSPVKDALTTAILDAMDASTAGMPTREEQQAAVNEAKARPPANPHAKKPEDVYPLESLMSEGIFRSLEVKTWMDTAERNEPIKTHSRYVSNRVHALALKKDLPRLKALRYILSLINFKAACTPTRNGGLKPPRERDDLKRQAAAPLPVLDEIRLRFSDKGELTKWHTDLLHTTVCALALHVDAFATDTHDLREDLRLDAPRLHAFFRELGARVAPPSDRERDNMRVSKSEAASHRIAKLRLPLEFPRVKASGLGTGTRMR